ncbi:hypothetical protein PH4a_18010 [Proteus hauseri]|nr:hypothetical protein PH4a_18010 [Proteus hauseri]
MQDAFALYSATLQLCTFRIVYFMDKKQLNKTLIEHSIEENVSRFFKRLLNYPFKFCFTFLVN